MSVVCLYRGCAGDGTFVHVGVCAVVCASVVVVVDRVWCRRGVSLWNAAGLS